VKRDQRLKDRVESPLVAKLCFAMPSAEAPLRESSQVGCFEKPVQQRNARPAATEAELPTRASPSGAWERVEILRVDAALGFARLLFVRMTGDPLLRVPDID